MKSDMILRNFDINLRTKSLKKGSAIFHLKLPANWKLAQVFRLGSKAEGSVGHLNVLEMGGAGPASSAQSIT